MGMLVVYKVKARQNKGVKEPDVPEHFYKWRICEFGKEVDEKGNVVEMFKVISEMDENEYTKIKDKIKTVKVIKID